MLIFEHLVDKYQLLDPLLKCPVKVRIFDNKMNPISYPAVEVLVFASYKELNKSRQSLAYAVWTVAELLQNWLAWEAVVPEAAGF